MKEIKVAIMLGYLVMAGYVVADYFTHKRKAKDFRMLMELINVRFEVLERDRDRDRKRRERSYSKYY